MEKPCAGYAVGVPVSCTKHSHSLPGSNELLEQKVEMNLLDSWFLKKETMGPCLLVTI